MKDFYEEFEGKINNTRELTEVCRGEWCRELESEIYQLEDELWTHCSSEGSCSSKKVEDLEATIDRSISNLPPEIYF